jgi:hypothetical protein
MQTPAPDHFSAAALFSRVRRRQRMLQFLEMFERRSWRCEPELPYLLPLTKSELRESVAPSSEHAAT